MQIYTIPLAQYQTDRVALQSLWRGCRQKACFWAVLVLCGVILQSRQHKKCH